MAHRADSSLARSRAALRERFGRTASFAEERALVGAPSWKFSEWVGRFGELVAGASGGALTLAVRLVHDAQAQGETVAWVGARETSFFPPDVAAQGIDLEALVVVRTRTSSEIARAADVLARSGAFGLIVLDLGARSEIPIALQSRLLGAALQHGSAVLCLTEAGSPPLGSLISLRATTRLERDADGAFVCALEVSKDKRRSPAWRAIEVCRGPAGLR